MGIIYFRVTSVFTCDDLRVYAGDFFKGEPNKKNPHKNILHKYRGDPTAVELPDLGLRGSLGPLTAVVVVTP